MQPRVTSSIALQTMGNEQGAYYFMRLNTGRNINHQHFNPLPLPQEIINGLHHLVKRNPRGLDVCDCNWRPFIDIYDSDGDESTYNDMDKDKDETYENDNNPPPGYDAPPVRTGVTDTDIRNL